MGFQVVNLNLRVRAQLGFFPGQFSAGADQTIICGIYVHLTAVVNGDLIGHQTLWEQLSGTPITFIGSAQNSLTIDYQQPAVKDDKVFRFWIDKGTGFDLYSDVTVYGNITEKIHVSPVGALAVQVEQYGPNTLYSPAIHILPAPRTSQVPASGVYTIDSTNLWISWDSPPAAVGVLQSANVFVNTGTGFTPAGTVTAPQPNYFTTANTLFTYRIDGTYGTGRVSQTFQGQPTRFSLAHNVAVTEALNSMTADAQVFATQTVTFRTKLTSTYSDSVSIAISGASIIDGLGTTFTSRTLINRTYTDTTAVYTRGDTAVRDVGTTITLRTRLQVGG